MFGPLSVVRCPFPTVRCLLSLILLFPLPVLAWSGFTHHLIAQESLREVAADWGLNRSLPIAPFQQFLEKLSREVPEVKTREDFARWLKINPQSRFDQPSKEEKKRGRTTPFEILAHYSQRADDGRDVNLPYDRREQFWFGYGTRTSTQAFRHMEKPAFNPLHPLNTFGFPLGRLGQATERAQIYFDLALTAHRLGEPYWAWNFLGVGLHYIQDLGNSYHSAQLLTPFFVKGTKAYLAWGRKQDWGWIRTVTHVVSNLHHFFEGYVSHFLSEELETGKLWREALRGRGTLQNIHSAEGLAKQIRNEANRHAFNSVQATLSLSGKNLLTARSYIIDTEDNPQPEDPKLYLSADSKRRLQGASLASAIVLETFRLQGKAIRTIVDRFLKATEG